MGSIPRQTPSASVPRTTPRSPYPMPPAAHESAPPFQKYGRTAAGGEGGEDQFHWRDTN